MSNDSHSIWSDTKTIEKLRALWSNRKRYYQSENNARRSAVLMPFCLQGRRILLFIRTTFRISRFSTGRNMFSRRDHGRG